jgi:phage terminase small subunit
MSVPLPRRPSTLPASAGALWKRICLALTAQEPGLAEVHLPLIESYVSNTLRLQRLKAIEVEVDPLSSEGSKLLSSILAVERHLIKLGSELRLSPKAQMVKAGGPQGGRAPGTGSSRLREISAGTDAAQTVHWLDRARQVSK